MKFAFNSLISSTGTFASLLKNAFFVDNLLENRAKDLPVIREETVDFAFNICCLSEDRSTISMPLKDRHWSGLNYWQIYAKHASFGAFLYLSWVSTSLSRVFEYSIRNSSSVRPRLGHSSPNQLCPWLVIVSHNRLTQTKDHKVEHWTVFGIGEGDKPGMTRRRPQSSPITVTLPANDNISRKSYQDFFVYKLSYENL